MLVKLKEASLTYFPKTPFEARALDNVSFYLDENEVVGLVGATGGGKSSLGQVLSGLLMPDTGILEAKERVSFLFQKPEKQLFEANIYDEVAFGPRNLGLTEREVKRSVEWALSVVGLDFDLYKRRSPFEISGGEMRRLAIASVLAMSSPVLILDEPCAGLDISGKRQILKLLKVLKNEGKSIVLISHDLGEVLEVCDRLVVLDKGRDVLNISVNDISKQADYLIELGLLFPKPEERQ